MDEIKKSKKTNFFLLLLSGWLVFIAVFNLENLNAAQPDKGMADQIKESEKRLAQLVKTTEKLKALVEEPPSKKTTAPEQKEMNAYSKWLKNAIDQMNHLSSRWETYLRNKNLSPAKKEMKYDARIAEDLKLYNLQYLLLRNKIYDENKAFQISASALKKKRETVRELILNLK